MPALQAYVIKGIKSPNMTDKYTFWAGILTFNASAGWILYLLLAFAVDRYFTPSNRTLPKTKNPKEMQLVG